MSGSERRRAFVADVHHGPDLVLTLDANLQRRAFEALDGRRGAIVVLDLSDGAIVALASSPAVDPELADLEDWRRAARQEEVPLRDRAISSTAVYSPPGSIFKIVVAAALAEREAGGGPAFAMRCPGYDRELELGCHHRRSHGHVDLERALVVSCNIYFARAAVDLGAMAVRSMGERFGFNAAEEVDLLRGLPNVRPLRPLPSTLLVDETTTARDLARVGFGQGAVVATPLQVARVGAVIANLGDLPDPFLARSQSLVARDESTNEIRLVWEKPVYEQRFTTVLDRAVAERLGLALTGVLQSGTGRNLPKLWWSASGGWQLAKRSPSADAVQIAAAGKTGSAWKSRRDATDDAWMVAWAPASRPRVLAVALVEDAGEGGKVAGPVVMEMLRAALEAGRERGDQGTTMPNIAEVQR